MTVNLKSADKIMDGKGHDLGDKVILGKKRGPSSNVM